MKFQHRFQVQAPLPAVAAFHRQSASMGAITPPPVIVRVHQAPAILNSDDEMAFTLWLGPLPLHWVARVEEVTPTGFVDRQLSGPFGAWVHRHTFRPVTADSTEVIDEIEITLADQWFWKIVGWGMYANLPLLFAYRAWQTKRQVQKVNFQTVEQVSHLV
jgi:ligand-binding SRPBCC domain-containing protein